MFCFTCVIKELLQSYNQFSIQYVDIFIYNNDIMCTNTYRNAKSYTGFPWLFKSGKVQEFHNCLLETGKVKEFISDLL